MPWIPRKFYQLRWALMNRNPLCHRVGKTKFTYGEALVTAIILAEMMWMLLHWSISEEFRTNVRTTGAPSVLPAL